MTAAGFVHLRLHTEYSVVDGIVRLDEAVAKAKADGQGALAITDLANTFGLVKFYKEARANGVKPLAGCDLWITNDEDRDKPYRLLVLVKNKTGYANLCELLTDAWLNNQHRGRAEVRTQWLEERAQAGELGLIALSGAMDGEVGQKITGHDMAGAVAAAKRLEKIFPGSFYLEIQRAGRNGEEAFIRHTLQVAEDADLPVCATHPIQFLSPEDFEAHNARICIAEGDVLSNKKKSNPFTESQYFMTAEAMRERFADLPAAIDNTVEIAKRLNFELELGIHCLPDSPIPDGLTQEEFLTKKAKEGLEERLAVLFPDEEERKQKRAVYDERLEYELKTIIQMGFPGYFLIVAEFIGWAKDAEDPVPVGPGRGSGAGSLVAYALRITNLDPIRYNLLFERFLNPERVSLPDFDIDFCQHGRDRVIRHVKDLYGEDAVSQIATFGTMAAKAAVRDTGRVMSLGYGFCDQIAGLIPDRIPELNGKPVTIEKALDFEPLLRERAQEDDVSNLLGLAQGIEGITRNLGMHAAGVVIAPGKLTDFCPLYTQDYLTSEEKDSLKKSGQMTNQSVVSQYDKDDVEAVGLVKFDFLGLTTLTILDYTLANMGIGRRKRNDFLDAIPLDDKPTFKLLTDADTVAVFQLESPGMQKTLRDAKPDRFEDIIALVALYRPGPMDLIPDYCRRKHGESFEYPDPRTEGILSETYGVMIYQEQVMQMAQIVGGYSLGGADLLRRAMGKKKPEEMAKHRTIFKEGAAKNSISGEKADEIFDLMEKFAGYGFNKSHATAYALLSYQTAYLKRHYPAEFFAANMSLSMSDTEKVAVLIDDARRAGIEMFGPDVNFSASNFKPVASKEEVAHEQTDPAQGENNDIPNEPLKMIRYGLSAVKSVGEDAVASLLAERDKNGPFESLFDFCNRIDRRQFNRRTCTALIQAGAFDCFNQTRATLTASLDMAFDAAEQASENTQQTSLFGEELEVKSVVDYTEVQPWPLREQLVKEKSMLGVCLSGNLIDCYRLDEASGYFGKIAQAMSTGDTRTVAGVVSAPRVSNSQRGRFLSFNLTDSSATQEVTVYTKTFESMGFTVTDGEYVVVVGRRGNEKYGQGERFIADQVTRIADYRKSVGACLTGRVSKLDVSEFKKELSARVSRDGVPVILQMERAGASFEFNLGAAYRMKADDETVSFLSQYLRDVAIKYPERQ